jgi:hypothetical protein
VADTLVRTESLIEFFKEHVETACARLDLRPKPLTSFYVVTLLCEFAGCASLRRDGDPDEALAVTLARALQSGGIRQRQGLKHVGDMSLFVSGFFADSLRRQLVDVDYYIVLGGQAYGSLAATPDPWSPTFAELAGRFGVFVDMLADVSTRTSLTSNADLLRLYEKWVRRGSKRDGDLLAERGIVPNASIVSGSRRLH